MTIAIDLLQKRGIASAAEYLKWKEWQGGWAYPTYAEDASFFVTDGKTVSRWKNHDSAAKPKYRWYPDGCATLPPYYLAPGAIDEIAAQNGELYIVSGEPDVLTLVEQGMRNVICWFGEMNVPSSLAADLVRWGVKVANMWPDRDKTGRGAALKVRDALYGTGIELNIYELPESLGDSGDLNRLWQKVQFDPAAFWSALLSCQRMKFQSEKPELPAAFYEALEIALRGKGLKRYNDKGFSNLFACPMTAHEHDDRQPAFSYHADLRIGKCMKCAETGKDHYLAVELGEALGIRWQDYIPQDKPRRAIDRVKANQDKVVQARTFREAAIELQSWLQGNGMYSGNTLLPMPFHDIRKLKGMAESLIPRKLLGIIAPSGRGKTSFIETMIDDWRAAGYNGIMWGPEWTIHEYVMRFIQRQHGPQVMDIARAVLSHKDKVALTDYQMRQAEQALNLSLSWPGDLYVVTRTMLTGDQLYETLEPIMEAAIKVGRPINYVVFDYIQMMQSDGEAADVARNLNYLKEAVMGLDLIGIVGSQVTKTDSRAAAQGETLDSDAMQMARSDALNLALTISRRKNSNGQPETVDCDLDDGRGSRPFYAATGRVAKNSLGMETDVRLFLDGPRMKWVTQSMPQYKPPA